MSVDKEWRIYPLTAVILHLELLTVCGIVTLQIKICKQFRKYDLCITISLTQHSTYYKKLPTAYCPIGCKKRGNAHNWRAGCFLYRAQQGHLQEEVMDGEGQQISQPGWKY